MAEQSNSIITHWNFDIVERKQNTQVLTGRHVQVQKKIHKIAEGLLRSTILLKVPELYDEVNHPYQYLMKEIDMEEQLWLGDPYTHSHYDPRFLSAITNEVQQFWQGMWNSGYAAWDFKLYLQPNGIIMIDDFENFGLRLQSKLSEIRPSIHMPFKTPLTDFFDHVCFSYDFEKEFSHTILEHFNTSRISYL